MAQRALAFDFGASSGRAILGTFDGERIALKEVHRFLNEPVKVADTLYWDVLRLLHEIKQGLRMAHAAGGFDSVGVDTWGVDFGLLDKQGFLLENPVHYRDMRTQGLVETSFSKLPKAQQYGITGIQFMELNTLYQLIALQEQRPQLLENADRLLFMPDLFSYFLTGEKVTEYSIATTSQLVDLQTQTWSDTLLEAFRLPKRILGDIIPSGTPIGPLQASVCEELDIPPVPVIAVCGHDTQSAITAVPSEKEDFAFLSCGTWSLFGTELPSPVITEQTLAMNFTNEGGYGAKTGFLKNIIGLWLIQESRRQYNREGNNYSYADLERLALAEKPFACFIDPDAPEFVPHGNIPQRVQAYCKRTGQPVPQSVGAVMRCIYESLAMKYRLTFDNLCKCTGRQYDAIHVIGGGTKDTLLCQMTADACETNVLAGPIEATVLGNIAVQLLAAGALRDVAHARRVIANSESPRLYTPRESDVWVKAYAQFLAVQNM